METLNSQDFLNEAIRAVAQHQYPHALNSVEILLARLERSPEEAAVMQLIAFETAGDAAMGMSEFSMAEEYYQHALALIDDAKEPDRAARCQLNLAECFMRHGNLRQSRHLIEQVRDSAVAGQLPFIMARTLSQLGTICWAEGYLEESIRLLSESLKLYPDEAGALIHRTRSSLGIALSLSGRIDEAETEFLAAMDFFQAVDDYTQVVRCLNNLAGLAFQRRDWDRAKEYLLDCVQLETETRNRADLAYSWYNLGLISLHEHDYRQARKYLNRSLSLSQEVDDRTTEASSLLQLGIVVLLDNDPYDAVNYLNLAHGRMEGSTSALAATLHWYSALFHAASSESDISEQYWKVKRKLTDPDSADNLRELAELINRVEYADRVEMTPVARELARKYLAELRELASGQDRATLPGSPEPVPEVGE